MSTKEKQIQSGIPQLIQAIQSTGVYSVVLALVPLLSIYYSGIPGLNLADVILALLWLPVLYLLLTKRLAFSHLSKSLDKPKVALLLFVAYCIFLLLLQMFDRDPQLSDIAIRTTRIVFYLTTVLALTPLMIKKDTLFSVLKIVSVLAAGYLLMQVYVYRTSGVVIRGYVPFWPLYTFEYDLVDYAAIYSQEYYRPTSFFLEPAHFSRYASLGIAAFLFYTPRQKSGYISILAALFVTITVALSTSSIGIMLTGFLWTVFAVDLIRKWYCKHQYRKVAILLMCAIFGIFAAFLFSPSMQFTMHRSLNFGPSSAFSARLGSLISFTHEPNPFKVLFGHGYGSVPALGAWMSGLTYVSYGTGIVGLCMVLYSLVYSIFRKGSSNTDKIYALLFMFLFAVDDSFNSVLVVLLSSLALFGTQKAVKT